ncbi:hypothetical protein IFR05_008514 [Cadophora sp. M221]|nr:hypothetical protein IFR05_008514 [Cadophora sp. M221]
MATNIVDDPWNWTVDRVSQELTTTQRSWQPGTLSSPDLHLLRQSLESHIVNGQVLLTQINHRKDVCEIFSVYVLNHQTWLLEAIRQFRLRSPQYLSQNAAPVSSEKAELELDRCLRELKEVIFGPESPENPSNLPPQPDRQHILPTPPDAAASPTTVLGTLALQVLPITSLEHAAASSNSSQSTPVDASEQNTDSEQDTRIEQAFDEPAAKRLKSGGTDPANESAPQSKDGFQDQETGTNDDESMLVPSPESSTALSPELGVDSPVSETEDGDQALLSSTGLITPSALETEVELPVPLVEGGGQTPVVEPEIDPSIVTKPPKRLALGMLTQVGDIDPDRNRDIPTYGDDLLVLDVPDPSITPPHLTDMDDSSSSPQVDSIEDEQDSDLSEIEAANQLLQENSFQGPSSDTPNASAATRPARPARARRARPKKYLAKNKLPVDDLFYKGVAFGADIPVSSIEPAEKYFSHATHRKLPSGQIRYVSKMMRNFMLSKNDLNRARRASGPNFSTDLLAVDILRDADGNPIPEVFLDPEILRNNVGTDYVESDDESKPAQETPTIEVVARQGSDLALAGITQPETALEVNLEAPESGKNQLDEQAQDDEIFTSYTAVRTYHEGKGIIRLMTWFTTPSFTLYYTTVDGEIRARRERLVDWPELMGNNEPKDFQAISPLQLIGSRPEPGPEYYMHWAEKDEDAQDEVIPLLGQSGAEYDTATLREMAKERQDRHRRRTRQRGTLLSPPQLNSIFDEAIERTIEKWQEQKLPKLKARAYSLWMHSRRTHTKRIQIQAARNDIQALNVRIANHRAKFLLVPWSSWAQATKGCRNTEPSVIDIEILKWKIDTLRKKTCPDNPNPLPSKSVVQLKAIAPLAAQEAGDDADDDMGARESGDDDDGDLGGFIVSDEESGEADGEEDEQMVDQMEDSEDDLGEKDPFAKSRAPLEKSFTDETQSPSASAKIASTPIRKSKTAKTTSEVIDLTESPPPVASSVNAADVIDLTTPEKNPSVTRKRRKLMLTNRSISPLAISGGPAGALPPYDNPIAIAEFSYEFWEKAGDKDRLLIRVWYKLQDPRPLLRFFERYSEEELWDLLRKVLVALQCGFDQIDGMKSRTFDRLTEIVQLGYMFMDCKFHEWGEDLSPLLFKVIRSSKSYWYHKFYELCSRMEGFLNASSFPHSSSPSSLVKANKHQINESDEDDASPTKRRRVRSATVTDDDAPVIFSPHSTRKRPVIEDTNAREARARNQERLDEQACRRAILKAKLAESGITLGQGKTKHIINDAAALDQGHIQVNEEIGRRIKQHQVDGVRFMWNQVVAVTNEHAMQGCLLAHTMGLGKTMQVITLLIAIAEAASSPDPTISSQIPSSLKGTSRTLILCPPGLIDNWMDELLFWTPGTTLGDFWKLSSTDSVNNRLQTISDWHRAGGVLIVGYEMFRNLVQNKTTATRQAPLTMEEHERVLAEILSGPDIIIADEAHKLKNAKSSLASAASQFRSKCRIALTGSPLANNVEEYHSMIEFVQPGYLGGAVEFRSKYKEPIEAGLFADSISDDRRRALTMLGVLNRVLALKVNRADLSVLRNDLPPKKEFIMSVPLTDIQRKVYSLYVQSLKVGDNQLTKDGEVKQATLWSWLATLSLLCNHPYCFNAKMQEGQGAALPKANTPDNAIDDNVTAQLVDVPLSQAGLSTTFVEEVTRLFDVEDLTQVNLSNKVTVLCQILDAAKEAGDKTLVFSSSIPTLNYLEKLFTSQGRSLARLDGKTPITKRQRLVKAFNNGNQDVFLISTTAGGLGLNLQSANRVVIFDFKYNPIQEEQALKPTFVYRFVCGGTFEDNVHNKTVFKSQLASRVVDKKSPLAYAKKKFGDFLFEPKVLSQKDLTEFQGMDPAVLDKILASQAQTATIRSIVQTDTFEMDDEDHLTPAEQLVVDRMTRELKASQLAQSQPSNPTLTQPRSSMIPHVEAQRSMVHPIQNGSSATPQVNTQRPEQSLNRSVQPATPQAQLNGSTSLGNMKQTPILPPPSQYPRGSFGGPSSQAGHSSQVGATASNPGRIPSSSASSNSPPIMGANTRHLAEVQSPWERHEKPQDLRRVSDMGHQQSPSKVVPTHVTHTPNANDGSSRSELQKPHRAILPLLRNAYRLSMPGDPTTSKLPEHIFKSTKEIADGINSEIETRFIDAANKSLYREMAFNVLRADSQKGRQMIESQLSINDFVNDLTRQGPPSTSQKVGISTPSAPLHTSPSQHKAHGVERSQSILTTSTSTPIANLLGSTTEQNSNSVPHSELERYLGSKNLSIIGKGRELLDRCKDQAQGLILAEDSNHEMLPEQHDGKIVTDVAGDNKSPIASSAMMKAMNGQFSSSRPPVQNLKTPVNGKNNRKRSRNVNNGSSSMRDDDARAMAKVDRNHLAKGALPVSRPHNDDRSHHGR